MSCYFTGRSWRYDFWMTGVRYTEAKGFKTKKDAERAEALRKEELRSGINSMEAQASLLEAEETATATPEGSPKEVLPVPGTQTLSASDEAAPDLTMSEPDMPRADRENGLELAEPVSFTMTPAIETDMGFLDLVNKRLDWIKMYRSSVHYNAYRALAKRWIELWGDKLCSQITDEMVENHLEERKKGVSVYTANKDRRYLRAVFRHGILKLRCKIDDPTHGIPEYPESKKKKYVPRVSDLDKVMAVATSEERDYLLVIRETVGRVGEINELLWEDVDLENLTVTLYTRKTRGGHRVPRIIPMTEPLYEVLDRLFSTRDPSKPWVFWHRYWSRKANRKVCGPYGDRKKLMKRLCAKAGVKYFRFHPIRHQGASVMAAEGASLPEIQELLGHVNRKTTEGYLHGLPEHSRRATSCLEKGHKRLGSK